ncbi:MAG: cysteine desulfurase [Phycisphaerales bacterium]|nr:cysteine desulfurase [Phycisphaerales bacterium]
MSIGTTIYLDNAATTRVDPRAFAAMTPYFLEQYGNAASRSHRFGREALTAVDRARRQAATLIGATPADIVWTSGSTESNNLAIKGTACARAKAPLGSAHRGHIITAAHEHKAALDPCQRLREEGFDLTVITPGHDGVVTADMVRQAIRSDTILTTIMWANNETGTVNDVPSIGAVCREHGITFHTDGTQWVGKMPVDVERDNIDLLSWSSHKMYGPKGIGALFVRRTGTATCPCNQIDGGGHEHGMRSGTLNVPGIVGFGAACELCQQEMEQERVRLSALRDRLERSLLERLSGVHPVGHRQRRMPHICNLIVEGVDTDAVMMELPDVACSTGSACTSEKKGPSHVLSALGYDSTLAASAIRLSLGRWTTESEIDRAIERIVEAIGSAREIESMIHGARVGA